MSSTRQSTRTSSPRYFDGFMTENETPATPSFGLRVITHHCLMNWKKKKYLFVKKIGKVMRIFMASKI